MNINEQKIKGDLQQFSVPAYDNDKMHETIRLAKNLQGKASVQEDRILGVYLGTGPVYWALGVAYTGHAFAWLYCSFKWISSWKLRIAAYSFAFFIRFPDDCFCWVSGTFEELCTQHGRNRILYPVFYA